LIATLAIPGIPPLKGAAKGKTADLSYHDGAMRGDATLKLDDSGRSFTGWLQIGQRPRIPWNGWRPDPGATKAAMGRFDGPWLTTLGLMELEQAGTKAKGRYALRGTSTMEGEVS